MPQSFSQSRPQCQKRKQQQQRRQIRSSNMIHGKGLVCLTLFQPLCQLFQLGIVLCDFYSVLVGDCGRWHHGGLCDSGGGVRLYGSRSGLLIVT